LPDASILLLAVDNGEEGKCIVTNDPAVKINACKYLPMMAIIPSLQG
jgi:hypothetical protein